TTEYQFFAMPHGATFTLDEAFWSIFGIPKEVEDAKGFEVFAKVYLGDDKDPVKVFGSGWIPLEVKVPDKLAITASQAVGVPKQQVVFKIKDWAPERFHYSIDWEVAGASVREDYHVLTYGFDTNGT